MSRDGDGVGVGVGVVLSFILRVPELSRRLYELYDLDQSIYSIHITVLLDYLLRVDNIRVPMKRDGKSVIYISIYI